MLKVGYGRARTKGNREVRPAFEAGETGFLTAGSESGAPNLVTGWTDALAWHAFSIHRVRPGFGQGRAGSAEFLSDASSPRPGVLGQIFGSKQGAN